MKKLLLIAAVLAAGASLQAQSVLFSNGSAQVGANTFLTDADGTTKLDNTFMAELYLVNADNSLTPVGSPIAFKSGAKAGLFNDTTPRVVPAAANSTVNLEVGAWSGSAASLAAAQGTPGAHWGLSAPVSVKLNNDGNNPPDLPATLTGLQAFSLQITPVGPIPEPSTLALGALGLGALLLRRRS